MTVVKSLSQYPLMDVLYSGLFAKASNALVRLKLTVQMQY